MSRIKSAYELATERVIAPRYKPPVNTSDDMVEPLEPINEKPKHTDFIECWKNPHGKTTHKDIEFVDHIGKIEKKTVQQNTDIKMINSQTYHYDFIPEVVWTGDFTSYSSNGRINRASVFGLSNKNVKVKIINTSPKIDVNNSTIKELNILETNNVKPNCLKIYKDEIPEVIDNDSILFISSLKKVNGISLNGFREIWVSSEGIKSKLKEKTKSPTHVIHSGVDLNRYNQNAKPIQLDLQLNGFVFLAITKWDKRKGILELLKSYMETFSSNDDVSLLIIVKDADYDKINNDFQMVRKTINKSDEHLPHIVLFDKPIPERSMPELYALCDTFISLSTTKENGLSYLESGASGKCIIACENYNVDFLKDNNCFLIKKEDSIISSSSSFMKMTFNNLEIPKSKINNMLKTVNHYAWDNTINSIYGRILNNLGG